MVEGLLILLFMIIAAAGIIIPLCVESNERCKRINEAYAKLEKPKKTDAELFISNFVESSQRAIKEREKLGSKQFSEIADSFIDGGWCGKIQR